MKQSKNTYVLRFLDSAVKQQLQAVIATNRFPAAVACNLPFCRLDVLELRRLFFKPSEYPEMNSIVWN